MKFISQLPTPEEIKEQTPLRRDLAEKKAIRDAEIADVFTGKSNKLILVIGPCSADRRDAVLDYISRLARIAETVREKILIIPRIYTNKPRTTGDGYKGMLHQPDPEKRENVHAGITAIRALHTRAIEESGLFGADELLYPQSYAYLDDLLSYVSVGARSTENQEHRLVASGMTVPVGMKNPTGGDLSTMINSITAGQHPHTFTYRNWEVSSLGNPLTHAILRGYVDNVGRSHPNYHYEDLETLCALYGETDLRNPALIVDCNHANSGKRYDQQGRIAKEVLHSCRHSDPIRRLVKGFMIESYIEDGAQKIGDGCYGKSITDPCLGWEKTERLILDIADTL